MARGGKRDRCARAARWGSRRACCRPGCGRDSEDVRPGRAGHGGVLTDVRRDVPLPSRALPRRCAAASPPLHLISGRSTWNQGTRESGEWSCAWMQWSPSAIDRRPDLSTTRVPRDGAVGESSLQGATDGRLAARRPAPNAARPPGTALLGTPVRQDCSHPTFITGRHGSVRAVTPRANARRPFGGLGERSVASARRRSRATPVERCAEEGRGKE